jgi:3-dehydroquinate synthetase
VGGKNGVNFKGYKNMVGVFNQPDFVIADIDLLKTLPPAEMAGGLAEIVKHACIAMPPTSITSSAMERPISRLGRMSCCTWWPNRSRSRPGGQP